MTGRYGKTDTWDNVPALGGFVTAGFVFSTTDASLRDCSTGMDATDATTDPAPDPGGAGNPSEVPAASVPATTVQTKTPNATSTVLSTATLVSTAEAQPADLETVTVTETVPAPADGADQGGHDRDGYDENPPADPETVYRTAYETRTERQTE
jgi:hypothetical protein